MDTAKLSNPLSREMRPSALSPTVGDWPFGTVGPIALKLLHTVSDLIAFPMLGAPRASACSETGLVQDIGDPASGILDAGELQCPIRGVDALRKVIFKLWRSLAVSRHPR